MFEKKYSKFLTVLIIIIVIALVGLLGYLGYDMIKNNRTKANVASALQEWETNVDSNKKNDEESSDSNFEFSNDALTGSANQTVTQYEGYNVMGKIEIPKTDVKYPILEKVTKRSIEVAVAILYTSGDGLNQPGTTTIIGHNYRNGTFFSDNNKLSKGDKINITDNSGTTLSYVIYDMFNAEPEDTSFMTKDTGGQTEIALSTCTDDVQQRLIILARAE